MNAIRPTIGNKFYTPALHHVSPQSHFSPAITTRAVGQGHHDSTTPSHPYHWPVLLERQPASSSALRSDAN